MNKFMNKFIELYGGCKLWSYANFILGIINVIVLVLNIIKNRDVLK